MPESKSGNGSAGSPIDPYRKYKFRITVAEGGIIGHFHRCDGFKIVTERIEVPVGDDRIILVPGRTRYMPVTLYSGIIRNDSLALWNWMEKTRKSHSDKRNVMLDYLGPEPNDVHGYVLEEAWICGWDCGEMDALAQEFGVISISLAYNSVSRGKA